jgi:transcriptional regulator with XRE-family HTH domain
MTRTLTPDLSRFGIRLHRLRVAKGLSQEALALKAGVRQASVSLLECGRRTPLLKTVYALASALNEGPSALLYDR